MPSDRKSLIQESSPQEGPRLFKAGEFWSSNVFAALLGGAGCGILLTLAMGIVLWENPTRGNVLFAVIVALNFIVGAVCLFPGNWIAAFPYAVAIDQGKGLEVYAPLKKLYIAIEDVDECEKSLLQQGYVVRLNRRYRLLKAFVIHRFFGDQADALAVAIQEEIFRRSNQ